MRIFNEMKSLQLQKLNHATYKLLLDVSPMVDQESNVLQHFLSSDLVSLGLWGNVMAKNMRVKGTHFEDLGFEFELPQSLMGTVGAVRVMRVQYDHYSKMCQSNKMPPRAAKDIPSYIDQMEGKLKNMEIEMQERIEQKRKEPTLAGLSRLDLLANRQVRVEDLERGLLGVDGHFALRSRRLRSLGKWRLDFFRGSRQRDATAEFAVEQRSIAKSVAG